MIDLCAHIWVGYHYLYAQPYHLEHREKLGDSKDKASSGLESNGSERRPPTTDDRQWQAKGSRAWNFPGDKSEIQVVEEAGQAMRKSI